jgi:hypothetical protein
MNMLEIFLQKDFIQNVAKNNKIKKKTDFLNAPFGDKLLLVKFNNYLQSTPR